MLEEIKEKLESKTFMLISLISMILSLILVILKHLNVVSLNDYVDPAWISIIISGYPIVYEGIEELKEKHITSELLVTIALIGSIAIGEIFAAGEICFIMAIGEFLEDLTVKKANKGLTNLVSLMPDKVHLIKNNKIIDTEIINIKVGDTIRALPLERIGLDGIIIDGKTTIDQSILTGESLPVDKEINDYVYQGTMNIYGSVDYKVLKESTDTTLSKMIELMKTQEEKEAPIKRIADKWASILVPVSLMISILTGIVSYLILKNLGESLLRSITILVTFCPCALTLSTPTAVMAGIGNASKKGVLIKSGAVIEEMGRTNSICFDKTGTLTKASIEVTDYLSLNENFSNEEILKIAASIEEKSEHPLAKSIVSYSRKLNIELYKVTNFSIEPGKGAKALINKQEYTIGSIKYINKDIKDNKIESLLKEGKVVVLLSKDSIVIGLIALSDVIRDEAFETLNSLKNIGYNINLLTGDNKETANYISSKLNIDNIYSNLLPLDKVNIISDLNKKGYKTVMVGDGVNDAPAMKTANIGISLSNIGSDITKSSASIILLNDDIKKIAYVAKLSRLTINTIRFNIILSTLINFIAIILSMLGILTPITGAIVHNIGSVLVVLNAAILIDKNIKD